jgi:UDP-glucuronate decarboxylase
MIFDGLRRLMATPDEITGPVNIGNPAEFTIIDLAKLIVDLTGSRSRVIHRPLPENDPKQRRPDISRAHDLLDWRPHTALKDGLVRTIAYFDNLLSDGKESKTFVKEKVGFRERC